MLSGELLEQSIDNVLDSVFNKALSLDPELPAKLGIFSGKVISIHFKEINKTLFLLPENNHIRVLSHYDGHVDTQMSGSPVSIMKMMIKPNVATMLLKGEVEISGDTRLGNAFKKLFREMRLDWQQAVSKMIGDSATQIVDSKSKKIQAWAKKSLSSTSHSLSEYLQEESKDIVTETELEIFNQQVDDLRHHSDRLQARYQAFINASVKQASEK